LEKKEKWGHRGRKKRGKTDKRSSSQGAEGGRCIFIRRRFSFREGTFEETFRGKTNPPCKGENRERMGGKGLITAGKSKRLFKRGGGVGGTGKR